MREVILKMRGIEAMAILLLTRAAVYGNTECPLECDSRDAVCVKNVKGEPVCQCSESLIGDGFPRKCHDIKAVVQARCLYQFTGELRQGGPLPYGEVVRQINQCGSPVEWCNSFHTLEAFLKVCDYEPQPFATSKLFVPYLGAKLSIADCALTLEEEISCKDAVAGNDDYGDPSGLPLQLRSIFQSPEQNPPKSAADSWIDIINLHRLLMKLVYDGAGRKLLLKRWAISFFDKADGIPGLTLLHLTADQARKLKNLKRRDVASTFYKEPDLKNQGSVAIYNKSGWDRGHAIPTKLVALNKGAVQETHNYAFIVPLAPSFNRMDWLMMEDALVSRLASSFASVEGQILLFTGTSNKEIQIVLDKNGQRTFKLVDGPERYLGSDLNKIRIPNSIWTLAVCIYFAPNSQTPAKLETIAYYGNNFKEKSKSITMSIPFKLLDKLLGVSPLNFDVITKDHIKHVETYFTDVIPQADSAA